MKIKFISLASGSSGNCYFLGTDRYGILVDAGIGIRTIKKTLKELGIGLDIIRAVFITHDHADHIKAVGHLGEKFGIPVYSTPGSTCRNQQKLLHDREIIDLRTLSAQR